MEIGVAGRMIGAGAGGVGVAVAGRTVGAGVEGRGAGETAFFGTVVTGAGSGAGVGAGAGSGAGVVAAGCVVTVVVGGGVSESAPETPLSQATAEHTMTIRATE